MLSQSDKDVIILASTVRGGIKCVKTTERACGYIIRPELWFNVMNGGSSRALTSEGIDVKNRYTNTDDIEYILNLIDGLEDLSPTTKGLYEVKKHNGKLPIPKTHQDVLDVLKLLNE